MGNVDSNMNNIDSIMNNNDRNHIRAKILKSLLFVHIRKYSATDVWGAAFSYLLQEIEGLLEHL